MYSSGMLFCLSGCDCSYVLGAVETFLNAVPKAGLFRGNKSVMFSC